MRQVVQILLLVTMPRLTLSIWPSLSKTPPIRATLRFEIHLSIVVMAMSDSAYETDDSYPSKSTCEEHGWSRDARKVSPNARKISREQFMAMICVQSYNLRMLATDKTQIYQTLLDLYMPEVGGDQITFKSLIVVAPSSQALSSAAKALTLSLINRVTEDPRFLTEANTVLSIALREANSEVSNPNTSKCIVFGIGQSIVDKVSSKRERTLLTSRQRRGWIMR